MTARAALAELDRLTTDLTVRAAAWCRQLRAVEAVVFPKRGGRR